ncbi:MAG: hypothetical protein WAT29_09825 [Thiolinea sp.]
MTKLAYLMVGLSLSMLAACSSKESQLPQQSKTNSVELRAVAAEAQPSNPDPQMPQFQALQAELAALQQRLQSSETALAQAQAELNTKNGHLQAITAEQQQWSQQQASLDSTSEQLKQLEQQLTQKDQQLNQAQINLVRAESECQQATLVQPDAKQVAGLDPSQVEH